MKNLCFRRRTKKKTKPYLRFRFLFNGNILNRRLQQWQLVLEPRQRLVLAANAEPVHKVTATVRQHNFAASDDERLLRHSVEPAGERNLIRNEFFR